MRIKYKVILTRMIENRICYVGSRTFKLTSPAISLRGKTYAVNWNNIAYINANTMIYFIDSDTGTQYSFKEISVPMDPDTLDMYVNNKIIRELSSANTFSGSKGLLIFAAIFGAVVGFTIGYLYMQDKILDLINQSIIPMPPGP